MKKFSISSSRCQLLKECWRINKDAELDKNNDLRRLCADEIIDEKHNFRQ
jgi:hypothetical protein